MCLNPLKKKEKENRRKKRGPAFDKVARRKLGGIYRFHRYKLQYVVRINIMASINIQTPIEFLWKTKIATTMMRMPSLLAAMAHWQLPQRVQCGGNWVRGNN